MKYRNKKIKEVSNEELLFELIKRNNQLESPKKTKRYGIHYETIVGIGDDHSAFINLTDDDYSKLEEMLSSRC